MTKEDARRITTGGGLMEREFIQKLTYNSGALVALEFFIFLNCTPDFSLGVLFLFPATEPSRGNPWGGGRSAPRPI